MPFNAGSMEDSRTRKIPLELFATESAMMPPANVLAHIEEQVLCRLSGRVRNFQLLNHGDGLILRGRAQTYHAKQLAQHAVMETAGLPICANEIEVT